MNRYLTRRRFLANSIAGSTLVLTGCDAAGRNATFRDSVLSSGEWLAYRVHRLIGSSALAREYDEADRSPTFRTNGNTMPGSAEYRQHASESFANWQLQVDGLVENPSKFSLPELRAMHSRTQITRHDCVEGWSAIGKWSGVPLAAILEQVQLQPRARYIVFHCADDFDGIPYYESIDLVDAFHPQTLLAYEMNDAILPIGHGAPLRLRVERQIGYKQAKFIMRVEAVETLHGTGDGKGGFWEDVGNYEWYAGI